MFPVISLTYHVTVYDMRPSHGRLPRLFLRHSDVFRRHDDVFPYHAYLLSSAIDSYLSRLAGFRYAQSSTRFVFPLVTYPTGRYSCLLRLRTLRLFVLVSPVLVYILGWRWDDPHLQSTLQPP